MFCVMLFSPHLDQIALAEEYHKPIMTVRLEAVSEMDPGLKLIIQRRQVQRTAQCVPQVPLLFTC